MKAASLLLVYLLASSVLAQDYYADVVVDLGATGSASVSGTANHPSLAARTTDSLTFKRGSYWLFNLTLPADDVFSYYVFDVRLPQGASVNYAKTSGQFRITTEDGRIAVRGVGKSEPFAVVVQYQIADDKASGQDYSSLVLAIALLALFAVLLFFWIWARRRKKDENSKLKTEDGGLKTEDSGLKTAILNDRQKDILDVIKGEGKPINQALVCERLGLPKSSVSRNVDTLEKMGLIKKTRNGMSTMLQMRD